ncbi:unnamed protein product [Caenorhabditis brenneri]
MAEPDSPIPALFKLSLTALIEHVQNKKLKISPDRISPNIHNILWETSTVLDLVTNTCHPLTRDWYSNHVIRPPVISVKFPLIGGCKVLIDLENRERLEWDLISTELISIRHGPVVTIRTGNQHLSTVIHRPETEFISSLHHYDRSKFEVINWICKAFRCEINELEVGDGSEVNLKWPKFFLADTLKIQGAYDCQNVLVELVRRRQKRNLRTTLEYFEFQNPIPKQLLRSIDFKDAFLNLANLNVEALIEMFQDLSQRPCDSIKAKIVDLTTEDLETIRDRLELDNFLDLPLRSRRRRILGVFSTTFDGFSPFADNSSETLFSLRGEKMIEFKFIETKPGIYNRIAMIVF